MTVFGQRRVISHCWLISLTNSQNGFKRSILCQNCVPDGTSVPLTLLNLWLRSPCSTMKALKASLVDVCRLLYSSSENYCFYCSLSSWLVSHFHSYFPIVVLSLSGCSRCIVVSSWLASHFHSYFPIVVILLKVHINLIARSKYDKRI